MKTVDLEKMSTKQFIAELSTQFDGADLSSKKKFIKETITQIIDSMAHNNESEKSEESDDEEGAAVKPVKKKGGGGGGLQAVKEISDELQSFLKCEKHMARTAIVKLMWEYIREHELQNPENRQEILLDGKMQSLFGVDKFTMFTMNKYIGAHIEPYKPVDLTTSSSKRKADGDGGRKSAKKKKDGKAGTGTPYRLSDELFAVTGKRILPRPQVVKALWVYIRKHDLQVCCITFSFLFYSSFILTFMLPAFIRFTFRILITSVK